MNKSVSVVGGGVIGLSVAWRAARAGWQVRLHDPAPGGGASWVAGGMLAPLTEGWPGEELPLMLGCASLDRWPDFAAELDGFAEDGRRIITSRSTLVIARDEADAQDLRTMAQWLSGQGHGLTGRSHAVREVGRREIRELEPALSPRVRLGLLAESELAADNRILLDGLRRACEAAGVHLVSAQVTTLDELDTDQIVLAAGVGSARLWPGLPVRPVKGEILRLRTRPGVQPPPARTIRGSVHGRPIYLVPRADGLVLGATQYEHGDDTTVTVNGVRDLIADAQDLFPGVGEYELAEAQAGLRPMSPDNLPLIGRVSERVVLATGHGRNGVLLAPITSDAVLASLGGEQLVDAKAADPGRASWIQDPGRASWIQDPGRASWIQDPGRAS